MSQPQSSKSGETPASSATPKSTTNITTPAMTSSNSCKPLTMKLLLHVKVLSNYQEISLSFQFESSISRSLSLAKGQTSKGIQYIVEG